MRGSDGDDDPTAEATVVASDGDSVPAAAMGMASDNGDIVPVAETEISSDGDNILPPGAVTGAAPNGDSVPLPGTTDLVTEVTLDSATGSDDIPGALAATGVALDNNVPLLEAAALDGNDIPGAATVLATAAAPNGGDVPLLEGVMELTPDGDKIRVPTVATGMAAMTFLEASPSRCLQTLR